MRSGLRAAARSSLRLAVMVAALLFLARGVAWRDVAEVLRSASVPLLAAVVALNAGMMVLKAVRLRLLLGEIPSLTSCLLAKLTASAINNVVPFRGGDVARLWMLERHARISKSAASAVAIIEGLFELLSLAAIASVAAWMTSGQRWAIVAAPIACVAAAISLAALKRLQVGPVGTGQPAAAKPWWPGWLARLVGRMQPGTRVLRRTGTIPRALGLSFAVWGVEITMVMLCARSIRLPMGPALAAVTLLGINLALALPSMPASAGAFESGALVVLMMAGVDKGTGVAFALLYHLVQVIPVTLVGLGIVAKAGVTLDRLPVRRPANLR
jgi:glycosyltransferase 2 family protein